MSRLSSSYDEEIRQPFKTELFPESDATPPADVLRQMYDLQFRMYNLHHDMLESYVDLVRLQYSSIPRNYVKDYVSFVKGVLRSITEDIVKIEVTIPPISE